ncbi:hypothetical protein JCM10212_006756 [Sporobolomyces blumeae]
MGVSDVWPAVGDAGHAIVSNNLNLVMATVDPGGPCHFILDGGQEMFVVARALRNDHAFVGASREERRSAFSLRLDIRLRAVETLYLRNNPGSRFTWVFDGLRPVEKERTIQKRARQEVLADANSRARDAVKSTRKNRSHARSARRRHRYKNKGAGVDNTSTGSTSAQGNADVLSGLNETDPADLEMIEDPVTSERVVFRHRRDSGTFAPPSEVKVNPAFDASLQHPAVLEESVRYVYAKAEGDHVFTLAADLRAGTSMDLRIATITAGPSVNHSTFPCDAEHTILVSNDSDQFSTCDPAVIGRSLQVVSIGRAMFHKLATPETNDLKHLPLPTNPKSKVHVYRLVNFAAACQDTNLFCHDSQVARALIATLCGNDYSLGVDRVGFISVAKSPLRESAIVDLAESDEFRTAVSSPNPPSNLGNHLSALYASLCQAFPQKSFLASTSLQDFVGLVRCTYGFPKDLVSKDDTLSRFRATAAADAATNPNREKCVTQTVQAYGPDARPRNFGWIPPKHRPTPRDDAAGPSSDYGEGKGKEREGDPQGELGARPSGGGGEPGQTRSRGRKRKKARRHKTVKPKADKGKGVDRGSPPPDPPPNPLSPVFVPPPQARTRVSFSRKPVPEFQRTVQAQLDLLPRADDAMDNESPPTGAVHAEVPAAAKHAGPKKVAANGFNRLDAPYTTRQYRINSAYRRLRNPKIARTPRKVDATGDELHVAEPLADPADPDAVKPEHEKRFPPHAIFETDMRNIEQLERASIVHETSAIVRAYDHAVDVIARGNPRLFLDLDTQKQSLCHDLFTFGAKRAEPGAAPRQGIRIVSLCRSATSLDQATHPPPPPALQAGKTDAYAVAIASNIEQTGEMFSTGKVQERLGPTLSSIATRRSNTIADRSKGGKPISAILRPLLDGRSFVCPGDTTPSRIVDLFRSLFPHNDVDLAFPDPDPRTSRLWALVDLGEASNRDLANALGAFLLSADVVRWDPLPVGNLAPDDRPPPVSVPNVLMPVYLKERIRQAMHATLGSPPPASGPSRDTAAFYSSVTEGDLSSAVASVTEGDLSSAVASLVRFFEELTAYLSVTFVHLVGLALGEAAGVDFVVNEAGTARSRSGRQAKKTGNKTRSGETEKVRTLVNAALGEGRTLGQVWDFEKALEGDEEDVDHVNGSKDVNHARRAFRSILLWFSDGLRTDSNQQAAHFDSMTTYHHIATIRGRKEPALLTATRDLFENLNRSIDRARGLVQQPPPALPRPVPEAGTSARPQTAVRGSPFERRASSFVGRLANKSKKTIPADVPRAAPRLDAFTPAERYAHFAKTYSNDVVPACLASLPFVKVTGVDPQSHVVAFGFDEESLKKAIKNVLVVYELSFKGKGPTARVETLRSLRHEFIHLVFNIKDNGTLIPNHYVVTLDGVNITFIDPRRSSTSTTRPYVESVEGVLSPSDCDYKKYTPNIFDYVDYERVDRSRPPTQADGKTLYSFETESSSSLSDGDMQDDSSSSSSDGKMRELRHALRHLRRPTRRFAGPMFAASDDGLPSWSAARAPNRAGRLDAHATAHPRNSIQTPKLEFSNPDSNYDPQKIVSTDAAAEARKKGDAAFRALQRAITTPRDGVNDTVVISVDRGFKNPFTSCIHSMTLKEETVTDVVRSGSFSHAQRVESQLLAALAQVDGTAKVDAFFNFGPDDAKLGARNSIIKHNKGLDRGSKDWISPQLGQATPTMTTRSKSLSLSARRDLDSLVGSMVASRFPPPLKGDPKTTRRIVVVDGDEELTSTARQSGPHNHGTIMTAFINALAAREDFQVLVFRISEHGTSQTCPVCFLPGIVHPVSFETSSMIHRLSIHLGCGNVFHRDRTSARLMVVGTILAAKTGVHPFSPAHEVTTFGRSIKARADGTSRRLVGDQRKRYEKAWFALEGERQDACFEGISNNVDYEGEKERLEEVIESVGRAPKAPGRAPKQPAPRFLRSAANPESETFRIYASAWPPPT